MDKVNDLESLYDEGSIVPSAPTFNTEEEKFDHKNHDLENIERLQEYERNLVRLDRLFISRGARFVLIIPILVIILYGFAESFTGSEPDWWVNHCLLYTSPSPRDAHESRMPSSA